MAEIVFEAGDIASEAPIEVFAVMLGDHLPASRIMPGAMSAGSIVILRETDPRKAVTVDFE